MIQHIRLIFILRKCNLRSQGKCLRKLCTNLLFVQDKFTILSLSISEGNKFNLQNKINILSVGKLLLAPGENNPKPQNNHSPAVSDTYDERALHAHEPYDSTTNLQTHLSYSPDTPQEHEAPLAQRLSVQMPDLLNPSRASDPDREDASIDPSELTERDRRGGMSDPSPLSAVRNGMAPMLDQRCCYWKPGMYCFPLP